MRIVKDSVVLDVSERDFKDGFSRFGWSVADEPKNTAKAAEAKKPLEDFMNPPVVDESVAVAPSTSKRVRVSSKK